MPERIQLSRTKGWRMPPNTVKVDRSTIFGNPWLAGNPARVWLPDNAGTKWVADCALAAEFTATDSVTAFAGWLYRGDAILPLVALTHKGCVQFKTNFDVRRSLVFAAMPRLRGKNLACWCPLDQPCHASVLLELANA